MNAVEYTDHQRSAIEHLKEWKVGALFMEPGTGKTRVALSLVNSTPCSEVFWIGPLRTLKAVQDEAAKWADFRNRRPIAESRASARATEFG